MPTERLSQHFEEREFLCKHCGAGAGQISQRLIAMLEKIRQVYDRPMRVASGFRCPEHNAAVGGAPSSAHLTGEAADIFCVFSGDRFDLLGSALAAGARRVGIGDSFIHIDVSTTLPQDVCWTYGGE
jgi:zinc D-Ala-D-Ala carboxypeptidase